MSRHVLALSSNPVWQLQAKEPGLLTQLPASGAPQPPLLVAHSLMSAHATVPLPVKPGLHVHVREPGKLAHWAFGTQPPFAMAHSLMSVQPVPEVLPSPP